MKSTRCFLLTLVIACGLGVSTTWAQRGVGDTTGVARQAVIPDVVSLAGQVFEVKTGPCENTTGPSLLGTHVLVKTEDGETLNIHLGPAVQVEFVAKDLVADQSIEVQAFRTEKMAEGHYVAQAITYGDRTVQLRDDRLRPVWAGGRGAGNRNAAVSGGCGPGRGQGAGNGYRRGCGAGGGFGPQGGRGPGGGCYYGGQGRW